MNLSRLKLVPILAVTLVSMLAWQARNSAVARAAPHPDNYYCITGTPLSGGINGYATPQPGLQCFTTAEAAVRYLEPYDFCVSHGADGWHVRAYIVAQPGMACYLTAGEAIDSLPASVVSVGLDSANPQACSATSPMGVYPPPGEVYFLRCTGGLIAYTFTPPSAKGHLPQTLVAQMGSRLRVRLVPSRLCHLAAHHHKGACAGIHTTRWQRG